MRMIKGQFLICLIIHISESSHVIDTLYDAGKKVWKFYLTLDNLNLTSSANPETVTRLLGDDHQANEKIRDQIYEIDVELREIENSINPETKDNLFRIVRSTIFTLKCVDEMGIFIESINDGYKNFYKIIIQDRYNYNRQLGNLTTSVFPNIESNIEIIRKIMTHPMELLPNESGLIDAINNYAKNRYKEICNSYQSIDEILIYLFKIAIIAEIKTSLMGPIANLYQYRENQDENYYEFEGMTQEIIFRYQPTGCPTKSCRNMWYKRASQCDARYYDTRSSCSSTPTECEDLGVVQACVLKSGPHKFQYVNSSIYGFYGSNSKCPEANGYILDNLNGINAGYATCRCQYYGSNHKISLMTMDSPWHINKVIIGLRFKRRNNILHIQPRVGELIANGQIQKNSESWLPIPNIIDKSQIHPVDKENSDFFLDDVILPPQFVLSGVKFNKVTRGAITGFAIELFGVPFDYTDGQLDPKGIIQLSSSRSDSGPSLLFYPVSPLQTKNLNTPSLPERKYIQLIQSLLESDFGQSMLPLFDAVPVTTDPPSPLGGLGIFHKGVEGYGGFISLRAYGIRHTQYFGNFTSVHTVEDRVQLFT